MCNLCPGLAIFNMWLYLLWKFILSLSPSPTFFPSPLPPSLPLPQQNKTLPMGCHLSFHPLAFFIDLVPTCGSIWYSFWGLLFIFTTLATADFRVLRLFVSFTEVLSYPRPLSFHMCRDMLPLPAQHHLLLFRESHTK